MFKSSSGYDRFSFFAASGAETFDLVHLGIVRVRDHFVKRDDRREGDVQDKAQLE